MGSSEFVFLVICAFSGVILGWASAALETLVCTHLRELLLSKRFLDNCPLENCWCHLSSLGGYWSWGSISVRAFSLPSALNLLVLRCRVSWMSQRQWAVPLKTKVLTMLSVSGAFVLAGRYPSSACLHWSLPLPHRWGLPFEVSQGLAWVRVG